jgi:hypothetical protein
VGGLADTGGILHLPEALARHPAAAIVLYNRVSSWGQAGRAKALLDEKTYAVERAVQGLTHRRIRAFIREVEEGKLSLPRRGLLRACEAARKFGAMVVASDLSRFLRSESFDHRTNREAWPTPEEFQKLRELTGGVPLATVERPDLTERERHSKATKRTGKAGRPRSIDDEMAAQIFRVLGYLHCADRGWRWAERLADVARRFRVSPSAIERASRRRSPDGRTWRQAAIERAAELGLHALGENGIIYILRPRFDRW